MNPMRDYLGVWPDVGTPPDTPFPPVCPRTGDVLCLSHVRYLEWDAEAGWRLPTLETPLPIAAGPSEAATQWALRLPASAPRSSKVLAARVLNGEYPPELDAILAAEATGEWLGTVGQRRDGAASVTAVTREADHPEYGPRYRVDLTVDGRECVWWTGESCWCDAGDAAPVRFTVKRHAVFHGRRVTTLTRVVRADAEKRGRLRDGGVADPPEQPEQAAGVSDERGP